MKLNLTTALLFTFFAIFSSRSQSVNDINWERPSYEKLPKGIMASGDLTEKNTGVEKNSNSDFTPAGDFYNSQKSLSVISIVLTKPGFVNIKIYDEKGNTVDELARSSFGKGEHKVNWNSSKFPAGTYYYSVITSEYSITKKIK